MAPQCSIVSEWRCFTRPTVTLSHFRSRDKDGSHSIRSAQTEKPYCRKTSRPYVFIIERELLPIEVLHCGNSNFEPLWLLWPWPYLDDLHIRTWPVFSIEPDIPDVQIMNFLPQSFRKLLSDRHVGPLYTQTNRDTDRCPRNYYRPIPLRFNKKTQLQRSERR